ncbi:MAG: type II toxin-antitoxin system HicA family toxin [Acidobacteriota bacterium]
MTANELRRKLKEHGAVFEESTNHTKVTIGTRVSFIPRHPAKEIKMGTLKGILKKLRIDKL